MDGRMWLARGRRRAFAGLFAVLMLVTACGDSGETADPSESEPAAEQTDTAAAEFEEMQLSVANYLPPGSMQGRAQQWIADRITELTDGKVTFEFFWQEALVKAAETLAGVGDGRADMGFMAPTYTPAELPLAQVVSLPFTTRDPIAVAYATQELYESEEASTQEWNNQGVHVLAVHPVGPDVLWSRKPVNGIDDLAGMKIRAVGYPQKALASIGVNPVALGAPELYEALQRNVIDASSAIMFDLGPDLNLHEVSTHIIDTGIGNYGQGATVVNLQLWESFSDELKAVFTQAGEEFMAEQMPKLQIDADAIACDKVVETDAELAVLPPAEVEQWAGDIGDDLVQEYVANTTAQDKPGEDFHAKFVDAVKKYEQESEYVPGVEACLERTS